MYKYGSHVHKRKKDNSYFFLKLSFAKSLVHTFSTRIHTMCLLPNLYFPSSKILILVLFRIIFYQREYFCKDRITNASSLCTLLAKLKVVSSFYSKYIKGTRITSFNYFLLFRYCLIIINPKNLLYF